MFIAEDQLDFHVWDRLDKFQIEKILFEFLEDSYVREYEQILVITGNGKVVKPLVDKLLDNHELVRKYNRAGYYNGQGGAFEVHLKNH